MPKPLTSELVDDVCEAILQRGEYPLQALLRYGARRIDASHWLARGEELERESAEPVEALDELCLALHAGVQAAEAQYESRMNSMWQHAITEKRADLILKQTSRAAAICTKLERRFPDRYKRVSAEKAAPAMTADQLFRTRSSSDV